MKSTQLPHLRTHLSRLRRSRWITRATCGLFAVALAVGWLLLAAFAADWSLHFGRGERAALLAALVAAAAWAYFRWLHRPLRQIESPLELALRLERQEVIDSDLVAALQFDDAQSGHFGSKVLEQSVIARAAAIRPLPALAKEPAARRLPRLSIAVLATLAVMLAVAFLFPGEVGAFASRLFLGSARYPTRTVIAKVTVNGTPVDLERAGGVSLRIPYGRPVRFEVECRGELPDHGSVQLEAIETGSRVDVPLAPPEPVAMSDSSTPQFTSGETVATPATNVVKQASGQPLYSGEFPRLLENVRYRLRVGDAETDPATIEVVPYPAVTVEVTVAPPAYAGRQRAPVSASGLRRISVLEGSQVDLRVHCANKPLQSAKATISGRDFELEPLDADRRTWRLTDADSPLTRVVEPVQFEITATDDDGLSPEERLRGTIAFEPDMPPRVAAGIVTEKVLPIAEPALSWGATDDYGLALVRLTWKVIPAAGEPRENSIVLREGSAAEPLGTALRGRRRFPLSPLKLSGGDEVRLTLEAVDDRGPRPGSVTRSEPIVLQVTDEAGILAALTQADEKSLHELDEMIEHELGIGETP